MRVVKLILPAAVAAVVAVGPSSPAWAAASWAVVPSANSSSEDSLGAVSLLSGHDAWAVGSARSIISGSQQERPLIEHYTGTSWKVVPSPSPAGYPFAELSSVLALSTTNVWAVGEYHTANDLAHIYPLAEHYDGSTWSIVSAPLVQPRGGFGAITGTSATDLWAVGSTGSKPRTGATVNNPLAEHYDGTSWSVVPTPALTLAGLNAVTAIAPNNVWAVGYAPATGVVLHYDGTAWSQVAAPAPVTGSNWQFSSVTATPTGQVWAAGYYTGTDGISEHSFVEHFNGSTWSVTQLPAKSSGNIITGISGITAISDTDIWVVGNTGTGNQQFNTLTEHFNGTNWQVVASPSPDTADGLSDVAASGGVVWAVGDTAPANTTATQTLTELHS